MGDAFGEMMKIPQDVVGAIVDLTQSFFGIFKPS
ncbi:hypothetical protein KGM_215993 [Danaus plexippus plexippus]|uniref:Uncharacterized protein n=1 Tax=Danaus plexippus plexippus TaxID=278856 RepID=A0A212FLG8_DANPL|nr:hypothetical protein KGM_215993 [Danaus plexippus plexippus]